MNAPCGANGAYVLNVVSRRIRLAGATSTSVVALAVVLLAPAAAGACPSTSNVHSLHGYVSVSFDRTVSNTHGDTITLDRSTTGMYFRKLTPDYSNITPYGTRAKKKFLVGFHGRGTGVFTIDDSFSNSGSGLSGTQTGESHSARLGIFYADKNQNFTGFASGCGYAVNMRVRVPAAGSGNWPDPLMDGFVQPEGGASIYAGTDFQLPHASWRLSGSDSIVFKTGGIGYSGDFENNAFNRLSYTPWEDGFVDISSGVPVYTNPQTSAGVAQSETALVRWRFAPNRH